MTEILDAMKNPVNGINFLAKSQSLPSWTFVLMDAITWLQNRIDGKVNPLEMLEAMKKLVTFSNVVTSFIDQFINFVSELI